MQGLVHESALLLLGQPCWQGDAKRGISRGGVCWKRSKLIAPL